MYTIARHNATQLPLRPLTEELSCHIRAVVQLAAERVERHRAAPDATPLSSDPDALENLLDRISSRAPSTRAPRYLSETAELRSARLGMLVDIPLDTPTPVARLARERFPRGAGRDSLARALGVRSPPSREPRLETPLEPTPPSHLHLDPIEMKYAQLGGEAGLLGKPLGVATVCSDGVGRQRHFTNGDIYWSPATGAHEIHGTILAKWNELGGIWGDLGYPLTDELTPPGGLGRYNHFEGGSVYWSTQSGAHEVHGAIRKRWSELGWEQGYLGFPTTDEMKTPDLFGRFNHFAGGSIYFRPDLGAHAVHQQIREAWEAQGWELGDLGYPIESTRILSPEHLSQRFQGGTVDWQKGHPARITLGPARIRFGIYTVKCVDETDGFWGSESGDDEMLLGGSALGASFDAADMATWNIGDFNDGTSRNLGGKALYRFHTHSGSAWPKAWSAFVVLAEDDDLGWSNASSALTSEIAEIVKEVLQDLAVSAGITLSELLGAGALGPLLGYLLGELMGLAVEAFIEALLSLWDTDFFLPMTFTLILSEVHDLVETEKLVCQATAHGGTYRLSATFKLEPE